MGGEEKRLACAYLKFFYKFFEAEPTGPPCSEGGLEFKMEDLEARLEKFIAQDDAFGRLLETYRKVFEQRKKNHARAG